MKLVLVSCGELDLDDFIGGQDEGVFLDSKIIVAVRTLFQDLHESGCLGGQVRNVVYRPDCLDEVGFVLGGDECEVQVRCWGLSYPILAYN